MEIQVKIYVIFKVEKANGHGRAADSSPGCRRLRVSSFYKWPSNHSTGHDWTGSHWSYRCSRRRSEKVLGQRVLTCEPSHSRSNTIKQGCTSNPQRTAFEGGSSRLFKRVLSGS